MKAANKAFLEENINHWHTLRDAQYLRHLDGNTRAEMQRILQEEFSPGYITDLWCSPCVATMVKLLYQRYEDWKEKNPEKAEEPPMEIIPDTTGESITPVKANFPKHRKKKEKP